MHAPSSTAPGFRPLAIVFALFVLFLYGPMITIVVLSFQGPEGGLTFPLRGLSLHWFYKLAEGLGTVDIGAAFRRSLALGVVVMLCTVVLSVLAGLAFRKKLSGGKLVPAGSVKTGGMVGELNIKKTTDSRFTAQSCDTTGACQQQLNVNLSLLRGRISWREILTD